MRGECHATDRFCSIGNRDYYDADELSLRWLPGAWWNNSDGNWETAN